MYVRCMRLCLLLVLVIVLTSSISKSNNSHNSKRVVIIVKLIRIEVMFIVIIPCQEPSRQLTWKPLAENEVCRAWFGMSMWLERKVAFSGLVLSSLASQLP